MKLRVSAGKLGGLKFDAPRGNKTHPMSEKIRMALFNMLGDIKGLTVLDAYSGSGALAFESISRGAKHVYAVEKDNAAYITIKENKESLHIGDELKVSIANISSWLKTNDLKYDIIFCDPPYNDVKVRHLQRIQSYVKDGGLLVVSLPTAIVNDVLEELDDVKHLTTKEYANASIVILKK